ncbi:MAG: hypothetical protein ACT4P2_09050 [Pseudomonadota bacterium]
MIHGQLQGVAIGSFMFRWRSQLPFSLRSVLRREYNGFYLIVVALTAIEFATDVIGEGSSLSEFITDDLPWLGFFALGTVVWLTLRTLKKQTDWLRASGR